MSDSLFPGFSQRRVSEAMFDCLADWREVAMNVTGRSLDCGHFLPEEAPDAVLRELRGFLRRHAC